MENKPIEEHLAGYTDKDGNWHQQGLTPEQLKELENRQLELKIGEIQMNIRKSELDKLEATMRDVQSKAKETQEKLDAERAGTVKGFTRRNRESRENRVSSLLPHQPMTTHRS